QPVKQATPKTDTAMDKAAKEEATLNFFTPTWVTDEEYESIFAGPLKKKYPNIHLERQAAGKDVSLEKLIAAGQAPDVMIQGAGPDLINLQELKLAYDLAPLIKQNNLDLKKFIPSGLDMVKLYSGNGTLTALPFTMGFRTMYYNRDLFDKFGVPYPAAHQSWEDTIELAKKVTRTDGGTQYFGLSLNGAQYLPIKNEARADFVDSKTNKAIVDNDVWKRVFNLTRQVYQIPGNEGSFKGANGIFMKDKRLAMLVASNELRNMIDINWDVTAIPTLKESPRIGGYSQAVGLSISATSKHKEAAFLFILNTLSDEVQLEMARNGRPSPLTDKKFVDAFGKGMKNVTDQHLSRVLDIDFTVPKSVSEYDNIGQKEMTAALADVVTNGKDINTALREAGDRINQGIQAELSK
ncbi:MAG: family 1 extracellular solute-binding protein, partial [Paenibacillaceae bacterium]|nr:family 1 extracellular solute-binding protein [Paenibacillaceae bacterium]